MKITRLALCRNEDQMKKIASSDLLAASMGNIIDSKEHKSLFAKPQIKTAKKAVATVGQVFHKLIQASEKLESLGLVHSSLRIMALASSLTKQAAWDETAHQELIDFLKDFDTPHNRRTDARSIGSMPEVFQKIKELTEQAEGRQVLPGPDGDLMDLGKKTNLDPEGVAIENMEPNNPLYEEMGWFEDEDLIEQIYVDEDADKSVSDEEEHGSLFEQLRGAK